MAAIPGGLLVAAFCLAAHAAIPRDDSAIPSSREFSYIRNQLRVRAFKRVKVSG